jgi:hypothetical protein
MLVPILVISFVALMFLADLYTTKRAVVDNPTRFHEANPIMAAVMRVGGFPGLVIVKVAVLGFIAWMVWTWQGWAVCGPALAVGVVTGFVAWRNKRLIAKAT